MATVWAAFRAPRIGSWQREAYASGWSHTVHFSSLDALAAQLERAEGIRGRPHAVTRLGIVAHGDREGVVQLDRELTVRTIGSFAAALERLRSLLATNAKVTFYSCIAGAGAEGERLLCAISERLPGRTIVGFTVMGETDANEALSHMSPQTPGRVREAPHGHATGRPGPEGLLGPWSVYAKWARDGTLVRSPPAERGPDMRCANPTCPGHRSQRHHCEGWH